MAGSRRYRKPLVSFEFGTRIYAPTAAEPRYRVVAPGVDGVRVSQKFTTEDAARRRARELEKLQSSSSITPGRLPAPSTVGGLIDRYVASLASRSTRRRRPDVARALQPERRGPGPGGRVHPALVAADRRGVQPDVQGARRGRTPGLGARHATQAPLRSALGRAL